MAVTLHALIGAALVSLAPDASGTMLRAAHSAPTDAKGFVERGNAWTDKGEWDKAIKDYTEAIRLDPKSVEAFIGRGFALRARGTLDQALKDFDEAVRLES